MFRNENILVNMTNSVYILLERHINKCKYCKHHSCLRIYKVCPKGIQPCNIKDRDIY